MELFKKIYVKSNSKLMYLGQLEALNCVLVARVCVSQAGEISRVYSLLPIEITDTFKVPCKNKVMGKYIQAGKYSVGITTFFFSRPGLETLSLNEIKSRF